MNEMATAVLALLGAGGLTGLVALARVVLKAFFQALATTAANSADKDRTIESQRVTIKEQDAEIDRLQLDLLAERRASGMKDIRIAGFEAQRGRETGAGP